MNFAAPSLLDKWSFFDALVRDPHLADLDRRLAFRFLGYHDPARGGAWPSLDTLAGELSVTKRACIDAVARLEARGWFACTRSRGRGRSNLYRPRWEKVKPTSPNQDPEKVNQTSPIAAEKVKPTAPFDDVKGEVGRKKKVKPTSPDSVYRTRLEERDSISVISAECDAPKSAPRKASSEDIEAEFATWWQQVPKKAAKGTAQRAYRTARKKATAEQLLAGIIRYAAEVQVKGTEPRFIAHPATWLNGERWLDEPPLNVTPIRPSAQATSPTMAAFADLYDDTPEAASERARFRL